MKNEEKILNIINELESEDVVIVLKGFPKTILKRTEIDLDDLMGNKKDYLKRVIYSNDVLSYEEFIVFRNNILEFYDQVVIIDNNLYNNIYPLNAILSDRKLSMLEKYFNLEYETELENFEHMDLIADYLSIYGDYKKINEQDYIVYTSSVLEKDEGIRYIDIYENKKALSLNEVSSEKEIIEIMDEEDYIIFLDSLKVGNKYAIKKPTIDFAHYSAKIELINGHFKDIEFNYAYVKEDEKYIEKYDEYVSILQKHWKHDDFYKIPNYDLGALEKGIKKTKNISQAEIIDTIVLEAEKAINSKKFNDVFVTAPTGSGKSAMFQIPAIYMGEKHKLMTIVISPLIGLMNDQIKGLEKREYNYVQTIHSDISPVKKQEVMDEIEDGKCHILYISPETLLSRGDVSQLIGSRNIGLFVIDEAHIVTTWGKQFRPDYWFLGDHLNKMRKKQRKEIGHDFPIATFTATAIYGGIEDMYSETVESLKLSNPKTYLGYIKRENIDIRVKEPYVLG